MLLAPLLAVHGAWDAAPTAWRITNAKEYTNQYSWYVRELEVYASPNCSGKPIPPWKPLGSISTSQQKFIIDGDPETAWATNTFGDRFAPRAHYVGFQVLKADRRRGRRGRGLRSIAEPNMKTRARALRMVKRVRRRCYPEPLFPIGRNTCHKFGNGQPAAHGGERSVRQKTSRVYEYYVVVAPCSK